jgi:hypothetical protein
VNPHVCCQCEFFHICPKVGCFEACIAFVCACWRVLATQTHTWLSGLRSQCSHSATEICSWKEGWRRRKWQRVGGIQHSEEGQSKVR